MAPERIAGDWLNIAGHCHQTMELQYDACDKVTYLTAERVLVHEFAAKFGRARGRYSRGKAAPAGVVDTLHFPISSRA